MKVFYDIQQAARRVGKSERTIRNWLEGGLRIRMGMIAEDDLLEHDQVMRKRRGRPKKAERATGDVLIMLERSRQIREEGYSAEHDAGHAFQLTEAAIAYAAHGSALDEFGVDLGFEELPGRWPWEVEHWKPSSAVRDLVKAGALIAAAIDSMLEGEANARV